jgi:hypothetical protein
MTFVGARMPCVRGLHAAGASVLFAGVVGSVGSMSMMVMMMMSRRGCERRGC